MAILLFTLLGAAIRFHGLGNRDFWFDESCTFVYVHHLFDWPEDSSLLVESTNLPYYVVLRGWTDLFGQSERSYRSFSALAATLVIPLLGWLAMRVGGSLSGVAAAAVAALHPLQIHYAQEARAYALWVFLLSAALLCLFQACRTAGRRWWGGYGAIVLLCLHLHYFTLYWIPASLAATLVSDRRRRVFRQWLVTTSIVGAAFLPYFLYAVWPAARRGGGAWIAKAWSPITAVPVSLWSFLPAGGYPAHLRGLSLASPDTVALAPIWLASVTRIVPAILVLVMVAVVGVRTKWSIHPAKPVKDSLCRNSLYFLILTLVPLGSAWLYSVLIRPQYLSGRYDLVAWPAFVIWLSLLLNRFASAIAPRRPGRVAAMIALTMLACSLLPIARMAACQPSTSFPNLRARRIAQLASSKDLILALSYDRDYLLYYLYRAGFSDRIISYPSWLDQQVGWVDTHGDLAVDRADQLQADAREKVEAVRETMDHGGRVWLLGDSLDPVGEGPRGIISRQLLTALRRAGYLLRITDVKMLIFELLPEKSSPAKDSGTHFNTA